MRFFAIFFVVASFFASSFIVPAHGQDMPFNLTAGNIAYDISGSRITATAEPGKQVHITSDNGQVWADTVHYNLAASTVTANGNVRLQHADGTTLHVQSLNLTGDLQQGALEQLRLSIPSLGEIAQAGAANVSGSTYTLTDVTYSPCKECLGDRKPWSLSASKMTYQQDEGVMTYNNAVMDVYGVPVVYLPWFRHPVGPKKPTNGLLPPQFGRSETLGENITIAGYVYNPAENADYTIRNRLMSQRGSQFMAERRQTTLTTDSEIRASYLNDTATGNVRNHLKIEAEKHFSPSRRIGINGEFTSDDTYLQQYFDRLDPYLASTAYAEDAGEQHYAALSVTRFQDLSSTRAMADTAQVLPHLELSRWFAPSFGGQVDLSADVLNIYRGSGNESRRIVTGADYTRPFMLTDGSKITLGATGRFDLYMVDNAATTNGVVTRLLPELTAMWEKPYISANGRHTIAPQVLMAISPRGGNSNNRVPNEDSVSYELDTSNLFESSRFAGLDRIETGPRLIYGLDNRWGTPENTDFRLFVGQSLRRFDDTSLPASGGASTNASDWVGLVEASPYTWLTLNSRFRLDNSSFSLRRIDSGARLGTYGGAYLNVTHSFLENGPQELYTEFNLPLSQQLSFRGNTRNDLATHTVLESRAGLVWTRDCYEIETFVRRRGYTNGDLRPGTDYLINLKLLTLGSES